MWSVVRPTRCGKHQAGWLAHSSQQRYVGRPACHCTHYLADWRHLRRRAKVRWGMVGRRAREGTSSMVAVA